MATHHVLLCTVGGSHQPIVAAIEALKDRASRNEEKYFVCFFCTEPSGGRPGSIEQITGSGNVVKANFSDRKPILPNIPSQTRLKEACFTTCVVPPDGLNDVYLRMRHQIRKLSKKFESARFVADYTGGTKAMTAALVCAALESENIELQVVIGARGDLVSVSDGTHAAACVDVSPMRIERAVARHLRAWEWFAYNQAARTLQDVRLVVGSREQERAVLALNLSKGLAHWDDSNYKDASDLLGKCKNDILSGCSTNQHERKFFLDMFQTIDSLAAQNDKDKSEVIQLYDLWLNAKRRAAQGRFDDAVSRWYRLMEWTAQWLLKTVLNVDSTAEFPREKLPEGVEVPGTDATVSIGMWRAWEVVKGRFEPDAEGIQGAARNFMHHNHRKLLNLIQTRNNSRLAHGFDPVTKEDWDCVESFTEEKVLPILQEALKTVNLKKEPAQLPQSPPEFLLWPWNGS